MEILLLQLCENVPTRWFWAFSPVFLNFPSNVPKSRSFGVKLGGYVFFFEVCEKRPLQKFMVWGGGGGHHCLHMKISIVCAPFMVRQGGKANFESKTRKEERGKSWRRARDAQRM